MSRQRELHDNLMAIRVQNPALIDAVHDATVCPYCSSNQGGSVTEEELRAEVEKATASLLAENAQLKAAAATNKVEVFLADARAEDAKVIEDLRVKLDTVVLEKAKIEDEFKAYKDEIEQAEADRKAEAEFLAVSEDRVAKVKEVAAFPDKYIEDNTPRWAAMPEDEFDLLVAEYASLQGIKPKTADKPPHQTALVASRNHTSGKDDMKELFRGVVLDRYITKKTTPVSTL
jgi:hypothetical protein